MRVATQARRPVPVHVRLLALPVVALVVLAGLWVTGGLLTDDARAAKMLTGGWLLATGALAVAIGLRRRALAVPVLLGWLVTAVVAGGFLLVTSTVDRVVDEAVVSAPVPGATPGAPTGDAAALLDQGRFRSDAHPTRGVAALLRVPGGRTVLTLTRFATRPGPDLRVYLVPQGAGVGHGLDLGRLRGNKGDQQYDVPPGAPRGAVVVWCRAFSVAFGHAPLRPAEPAPGPV